MVEGDINLESHPLVPNVENDAQMDKAKAISAKRKGKNCMKQEETGRNGKKQKNLRRKNTKNWKKLDDTEINGKSWEETVLFVLSVLSVFLYFLNFLYFLYFQNFLQFQDLSIDTHI